MRTEIVDDYGRRVLIEWTELGPKESLDHVISGYWHNSRGESPDQEAWRARRVEAARQCIATLITRVEVAERERGELMAMIEELLVRADPHRQDATGTCDDCGALRFRDHGPACFWTRAKELHSRLATETT